MFARIALELFLGPHSMKHLTLCHVLVDVPFEQPLLRLPHPILPLWDFAVGLFPSMLESFLFQVLSQLDVNDEHACLLGAFVFGEMLSCLI